MWWLSFVQDGVFSGVIIVQAATFVEAMILVSDLDIHPGGEVSACQLPEHYPPTPNAYLCRLLSKADCEQIKATIRRQLH